MSTKGATPETIQAVAGFVSKMIEEGGGVVAVARAMDEAGVSIAQSTLSDIASGKGVGLRAVIDLANYRKCSVDEVVGRVAQRPHLSAVEIAALYHAGRFSERAVSSARAAEARGDVREPRAWVSYLQEKTTELASADEEEKIAKQSELRARPRIDRRRAR